MRDNLCPSLLAFFTFSTSLSVRSLHTWVERVTQTVAQEVDPQCRQHDEQRREEPVVPVGDVAVRLAHDVAPRRRWSANAQAEEAETSLKQNGGCDAERCRDDNWGEAVGQHVAEDNA